MLSFLAWVWKEKILLGLTFLFVTRANIAVFFLLLWQKFKLNLNILVTAVTIVCYLGPISYHDHVMDAVVLERVLLADTKEYAFSKNTVTGPDSSNSHFVVTREEHQPQNCSSVLSSWMNHKPNHELSLLSYKQNWICVWNNSHLLCALNNWVVDAGCLHGSASNLNNWAAEAACSHSSAL